MFIRHPFSSVVAAIILIATAAVPCDAAPRSSRSRPAPARTEAQIVLVSDLIGQFWTLGDTRVYIHDIAFARLPEPGGGTVALRADLELEDGSRRVNVATIDELPAGAYEVFALDEAFPGTVPRLWWVDASGDVRMSDREQAGPVAVGGRGEVVIEPQERCTVSFVATCQPTTCAGACSMFPVVCGCDSGACVLSVQSAECTGRCPGTGRCLMRGGGSCSCAP